MPEIEMSQTVPFAFRFWTTSTLPDNLGIELIYRDENSGTRKGEVEEVDLERIKPTPENEQPEDSQPKNTRAFVAKAEYRRTKNVVEFAMAARRGRDVVVPTLLCVSRKDFFIQAVDVVQFGTHMLRTDLSKVRYAKHPPEEAEIKSSDETRDVVKIMQISFEHFDYEDETRDSNDQPTAHKVKVEIYRDGNQVGVKIPKVTKGAQGDRYVARASFGTEDVDEVRFQPLDIHGKGIGNQFVWTAGLGTYLSRVSGKTDAGKVNSVVAYTEESPIGIGIGIGLPTPPDA